MGCSNCLGGGEPLATSACGVAFRGEGGSFAPGRSTHHNSLPSFQPSIGATGRGFAVPPASGTAKSGGLRRSIRLQACSASGWKGDGLGWLAARLSREGWAIASCAPSKGVAREARANAEDDVAPKEPSVHGAARIGRSRGVPVRRNRFVAEVVRQRWTQRSVRTPFHPIWVAHRDGGLVRRQQASAKSAARHLRMNRR